MFMALSMGMLYAIYRSFIARIRFRLLELEMSYIAWEI